MLPSPPFSPALVITMATHKLGNRPCPRLPTRPLIKNLYFLVRCQKRHLPQCPVDACPPVEGTWESWQSLTSNLQQINASLHYCTRSSPNGRGVYTWHARRCTLLSNDRGQLGVIEAAVRKSQVHTGRCLFFIYLTNATKSSKPSDYYLWH